ncbi:MAG: hypothetical protein PHC51_10130 [bacterium]|nr:hypothetical protein [bacterium]
MNTVTNRPILLLFYVLMSFLLSSCSAIRPSSNDDGLPILSQDELIRPYIKLGRIQVTRETYGSDYSLSPGIKAWGLAAVRQEAEKMGADAIMFPEVTGRVTTYGIIPSTEYCASGFAIKFK